MKRKIVPLGSLALVFGLALAVAGPAAAQDLSSFYVTPKIMMSYQKGDMTGGRSERDSVFGLGLSVGADLSYSTAWPVRVEAEYLYHGSQSFMNGTANNEVSAHSLLANAFIDIQTDTALTPYFGGGLGLAWLNNRYTNNNPNSSFKVTRCNFAWDLGAGVAWSISENLALDLGYRYMDLGKTDNIVAGNSVSNVSLTAHEFSLGLRITGF